MNNNTSNEIRSFDRTQTPLFWVFHPFGRGIGVGAITWLFTNSTFSNGFIYGGLSGLTNLGLRIVRKEACFEIKSPEAKAVTHLFHSIFTWTVSASIMHFAYKQTGNVLFRNNPKVAIGTAIATEVFGYANRDLILTKNIKDFVSSE